MKTLQQPDTIHPQSKIAGDITLVLADEWPIIRQGIRSFLKNEQNYSIVGETDDGIEALQLVGEMKPDILIMDLVLKGTNGIEVTRQIRNLKLKTKIIIFTIHSTGPYILDSIRAGAMGYMLKQDDLEEINSAIKQVMNGHHYLSGPLADYIVDIYSSNGDIPKDPYNTLTNKEKEILQLVALGKTNNEIASRLCISRRTVEVHRTNIIRKLGLKRPHIDLARYLADRELMEKI